MGTSLASIATMHIRPTGKERFFGEDEIIVSKTDREGKITYANDVFLRIASYTEAEVIGKPHSLIRHPDMPRCVFDLLWKTIQAGEEIFAYVVNMAKNGDHYWVFAHVTPTFSPSGQIIGYHSNRRCPEAKPLQAIKALYAKLLEEEAKHAAKRDQILASTKRLDSVIAERGVAYNELMFSL